jgi:hypothetical protein
MISSARLAKVPVVEGIGPGRPSTACVSAPDLPSDRISDFRDFHDVQVPLGIDHFRTEVEAQFSGAAAGSVYACKRHYAWAQVYGAGDLVIEYNFRHIGRAPTEQG